MIRNIPLITKNLLIINLIAFLAMLGLRGWGIDLNDVLGLHFFLAGNFHVYQLFTYMFMHGGWEHILFNMFALWMFGSAVEYRWGTKRFLFFYIFCGVGAGLLQEMAQLGRFYMMAYDQIPQFSVSDTMALAYNSRDYLNLLTTVGASGAIYAVMLAFGMTFPNERIFIFPIPFPIKSKWFVVMSKYQGYTDQSYKHATLSELKTWYDQKRSAGYFLTQATYSSGKWWWVVTRGTNIESQGYTWAADGDVGSEVKKIWNKGYRLHLVEYGGGQYLLAYGKLKGRTPQQAYNIDYNGVTAWLSKNWDNGMKLHYIGGGNPESQANNVASNQSNNGYSTTYQPGNNSWREELPGGGFRQNTRQADGSIISITSTPCLWCHGTKVCGICHGLGGTYGRAYGGMWYPCKS